MTNPEPWTPRLGSPARRYRNGARSLWYRARATVTSAPDRLRHRHNRLCVESALYSEVVRRVFLTPNPLRRAISRPSTTRPESELARLRRDGIVLLERRLPDLVDHLEETYFRPAKRGSLDCEVLRCRDVLGPADVQTGLTVFFELSFADPVVRRFFLDEDLCALFRDYYGRQPYYRNLPIITETSVTRESGADPTQKFHVDRRLHQLSVMVLTHDLTVRETHMQYALGSHRDRMPHRMGVDRHSFADSLITDRYRLCDLVGPRGSAFVFDAGNGFHRALPVPGTTRRILHMNVTTAYFSPVAQRKDPHAVLGDLRGTPAFIRRMFRKVTV